MKVVAISDTHGLHDQVKVPSGDVLIHCGDVCNRGSQYEVQRFLKWFDAFPHMHKVFIAGNHDFFFEEGYKEDIQYELSKYPNITYLQDSMVEIDGVKIYGSPYTPTFFDWAFMLPRGSEQLRNKWLAIPDRVNILVTHGPAKGVLDTNIGGEDCGCELLRMAVVRTKPKYHLFGHIHEGYGVRQNLFGTMSMNCSVVDERYRVVNKPMEFEI